MKRTTWPWILMIVLLVILAGAWAASSLGVGKVEVPDVTGMSFGLAKQDIERAGLLVGEMRYAEGYDEEASGPGYVLEQNPAAGEMVRDGEKIELTLGDL